MDILILVWCFSQARESKTDLRRTTLAAWMIRSDAVVVAVAEAISVSMDVISLMLVAITM